jgi:3-methyl-2-oxobutanoate hydroxymethyltransferase
LSAYTTEAARRVTPRQIVSRKGGEPIVCLTAYTAPMAAILDEVCDVLLVGDSVGMVVHGLPNTIGVTLEMMILHGQAVTRASRKALVVVDMPFGAYEGAPERAYDNAVRILKETQAQAVKVESGPEVAETIAYLTRRGIPVMGHVGLRPQAVLLEGGFRARGKRPEEAACIIAEAEAAAAAGAFCVVVEGVAESLAAKITASIPVPTVGIGASAGCDGQILVTEDMLGLFEWTPKFVRRYADLRGEIARAVRAYAADVRSGAFPGAAETYFSALKSQT